MQAPRALYPSAACIQWAKQLRQATSRCQISIQYIIKCMATHRGSQHWLCMGDLELAAMQTMRTCISCCIASVFHATVHLFCAITAIYDAAEDHLGWLTCMPTHTLRWDLLLIIITIIIRHFLVRLQGLPAYVCPDLHLQTSMLGPAIHSNRMTELLSLAMGAIQS